MLIKFKKLKKYIGIFFFDISIEYIFVPCLIMNFTYAVVIIASYYHHWNLHVIFHTFPKLYFKDMLTKAI
jgi:hypothetical protein